MASASKMTKTQFFATISESAHLEKKQVVAVFDALAALIKDQLSAAGPGELTIPGLIKLKAKATLATEDRQDVHPFTKEKALIKGKPASRKVRATPIKALKDLIAGK